MEFAEQLEKFEQQLNELVKMYEQYFQGQLKREPYNERQNIIRTMRRIGDPRSSNTQLKFRFSTIKSRYESMSRYWDRILLDIEKGAYKPDQFKADIRIGRMDDIKHGGPRQPLGAEAREIMQRKQKGPSKTERDTEELRKIYREFVEARRSTNEKTDIDFKKFSNIIRGQRSNLESRTGKNVSFRVVIENGKTKIKATKRNDK